MGFVWLIIIGAAAGFFATRIMKVETDTLTTVAIGVVGALVGGVLIRVLVAVTGLLAGLVGAVLGAVVILWVWKTYLQTK